MNKALFWLLFSLVSAGCTFHAANEFQTGRAALQAGNPESAAGQFQRIAESQPDYIADTPPLRQSIWSYLGRAYFEAGKLADSRSAFTRALQRDDGDFLSRLYVGLIAIKEESPVAKADNALGLNDVLFALREKVSAKRMIGLVNERGASFILTPDAEQSLRKAGADEQLMVALRNSIDARVKAFADTPTGRGLREAERALKEMRTWYAGIRKTEYGPFWDARKRLSAQIDQASKALRDMGADRQGLARSLETVAKTLDEEVNAARQNKLTADKRP
jgi:tetratricopeptide (TPR) repeat protein